MNIKKAKYIVAGVAGFVALVALSWGLEYLGIVRMGIFAPMRADVQRQVFEQEITVSPFPLHGIQE
ncbi:MAG: hypothetical protein AAFR76_15745 [Planctomycetota bacterium]